ncbi:hypothetical protein AHF37_07079 [Paragonimus kellicotti]|nr:hypothetical protein AHF37_07079 [Paragonimus kellicotti]
MARRLTNRVCKVPPPKGTVFRLPISGLLSPFFSRIHEEGRGVFASGSPFLPVSLDPKTCPELKEPLHRHPGQANNAYIFPGVALAIVSGRISPVTDDDFLVASEVRIITVLYYIILCLNVIPNECIQPTKCFASFLCIEH